MAVQHKPREAKVYFSLRALFCSTKTGDVQAKAEGVTECTHGARDDPPTQLSSIAHQQGADRTNKTLSEPDVILKS